MRLLFITYIIVLSLNSYAQKCVVANAKMNVVYVGIPNPIDIAVEGYKCPDITLTTNNGKAESTPDRCSYQLFVEKPGIAGLIVSDRKSGKKLGESTFRVKYIPDPVPMIGGKSGGSITKSFLKMQKGVVIVLAGFDFDARFIATAFTIAIIRNKNIIYDEVFKSAIFTPATLRAFDNLETGDRIFIENIRCLGPDNRPRLLTTMEFVIVD